MVDFGGAQPGPTAGGYTFIDGGGGGDPFLAALKKYADASGTAKSSAGGGKKGKTKSVGGGTTVATDTALANQFYSWDDQKLNQFRNKLSLAGYDVSKMDRLKLAGAWQDLANQSEAYKQHGKNISPLDILNTDASSGFGTGASKTTTHQMTTVNFTDPNTARAIANQTIASLLGRNPTNVEIKQFTDSLHSYEAANPMTSNQVVDSTTGMVQSEKSVDKRMTQAGAQQMAEDQVKKTAEYGSVQAATTYMDALRKMVNGG